MKVDRDVVESQMRAYYEGLKRTERRELFHFSLAYRSRYNEIVKPQRKHVDLPDYFYEKWGRVLKPTGCLLYINIRRIAFANDEKPEYAWCFPIQEELGDLTGTSRRTTQRYLDVLERWDFIERTQNYLPNPNRADGQSFWRKVACRYKVWLEVPLLEEDAVRALVQEGAPRTLGSSRASEVSKTQPTHSRHGDAYGSHGDAPTSHLRHGGARMRRDDAHTRQPDGSTLTSNVDKSNVREPAPPAPPHRAPIPRPGKRSLEKRSVTDREKIVREIARILNGCAGKHDCYEHKSAGFHRKVAQRMSPTLVREALRATHDAAYEAKVRGKALGDAGSYFGGTVRRIAEREGIDLGMNWRKKPAPGQRH